MRGGLMVMALVASMIFTPFESHAQFFAFDNPIIGEEAPGFSLENLKGEKKTLAQLQGGQPIILFFWATWCPHCREQIKDLHNAQSEIEKKNIKVVAVDIGEDRAQVQSYVSKYNIQLEILLDQESSVAGDYGLVGVPTFYLIGADGKVKAVEHALPADYEKILQKK